MEKYLGVKFVEAEPMQEHTFCEMQQRPGPPATSREGYRVRYPDGYESWCPKAQFESANRRIDANAMPFGHAIEAARQGKKIARAGWNGKGMFVVMMPALNLPPFSSQEPGAKVNDRTAKHIGNDTPLNSQPYFAMLDAMKRWVPGWLASQTDMLADDWIVVE